MATEEASKRASGLTQCWTEARSAQGIRAFTNDVSREGEGGGYQNSDAVREVA